MYIWLHTESYEVFFDSYVHDSRRNNLYMIPKIMFAWFPKSYQHDLCFLSLFHLCSSLLPESFYLVFFWMAHVDDPLVTSSRNIPESPLCMLCFEISRTQTCLRLCFVYTRDYQNRVLRGFGFNSLKIPTKSMHATRLTQVARNPNQQTGARSAIYMNICIYMYIYIICM